MNTKRIASLLVLAAASALCSGCGNDSRTRSTTSSDEAREPATGPHGGRLLIDGSFTIELAIFETGVPAEYRAWPTVRGRPIPPGDVELAVELARLGGVVDRIGFSPAGDYLRGDREVEEPHSFDVEVTATHAGTTHRFTYESHEGRTTIPADVARAAGIETGIAAPQVIAETLHLYGSIVPDATRVREVKARFPGVIRGVHAGIGDRVAAGQALATVESDESLESYAVTAPIAGVVTMRHAEPGEQARDEELFEIADYSSVWADFRAFPADRARVRVGQTARVAADGGAQGLGTIGYLAPAGDRASQTLTARIVLDNADGRWVPGQFVEATVTVAETPVELAVPVSALQTFRDFDVVFARFGDTYEVRMLELGRRDAERVQVVGGLARGTEIVTANSYLVKADIEKAGASHDH